MVKAIGIRREDKNQWETRVPLTPEQVRTLVEREGVTVEVQPSPIRTFPDKAYGTAGATLSEDLEASRIVLGIKEMPLSFFRPGGVYVFFSHTMKGQPHNMPLLKKIMEVGCTLIDYELVVDKSKRRLIFFGRYAGFAGMIDTLWALGKRLEVEGASPNPFKEITQCLKFENLDAGRAAIKQAGEQIAKTGLPPTLVPLVVGFAGYGNVSTGAQEIFDLLPHEDVAPEDLSRYMAKGHHKATTLAKVVYKEEHMAARKDGSAFELQDYYAHPDLYKPIFSPHLSHLTVLVNGIYWEARYPRLATKQDLAELFQKGPARLRVVGDISCDVEGAVQCTVRSTDSGAPTYVYDPLTGETRDGFEGRGVVVLAVDNLPCELPKEASSDFGNVLVKFIPALAGADFSVPTKDLALPDEIKNAIIVHNGRLTERFAYLARHLPK
jgi:saccharopine dehydrogenase (NAD+, L-lysine-forming)